VCNKDDVPTTVTVTPALSMRPLQPARTYLEQGRHATDRWRAGLNIESTLLAQHGFWGCWMMPRVLQQVVNGPRSQVDSCRHTSRLPGSTTTQA
jgi:hypothetical protein